MHAVGSEARSETIENARAGRPVDVRPIEGLLRALVTRYQPEQIWLFGSRGRGEALPSSDWDLLVVVPDSTPEADLSPLVPWRLKREADVRADVIVYRSSEFVDERGVVNTLAFEVCRDGFLLHGR